MVRAAQFARILVFNVGRGFERVGRAAHAASRGRSFASGNGHRGNSNSEAGARPGNEKGRLLHAIEPKRQPLTGRASSRAAGLERGERHGLARLTVGPQNELERLVIGLAGLEGGIDHGRALRVIRARAPSQA